MRRINGFLTKRFGAYSEAQYINLSPRGGHESSEWIDIVRGSPSLTLEEKLRLFLKMPSFSTEEIKRMVKILEAERQNFIDMPDDHQPYLLELEYKALAEWWKAEKWFELRGWFTCPVPFYIGPEPDPTLPPHIVKLLEVIYKELHY